MTSARLHLPGLAGALLVCTALVLSGAPPAYAAARVAVVNLNGAAVIDPTFATTLTLRGSGFQSIRNGHGGIYVLFGVVKGSWKPSAGGSSGRSYLTVPDSETRNNAGYAKFIAFPGGDTAGSANGGTIRSNGTWETRLTVPGGTFSTLDADQNVVKVDCRTSTCGVITIGAHGVSNATNETFTPVRVGRVADAAEQAEQNTGSAAVDGTGRAGSVAGTSTGPPARPAPATAAGVVAVPTLEVDRASAKPGRILAFSAAGLSPGTQVSATFDDGAAAVGPMTVGATGQLAGVLRLPGALQSGTYELRIVGGDVEPSVQFAVVAAPTASQEASASRWSRAFLVGSAAVLAGAVLFAGLILRRRRAR